MHNDTSKEIHDYKLKHVVQVQMVSLENAVQRYQLSKCGQENS